jgi:hypothetical protein
MMMDWNEYHKEIGATLGELMKLSPDTVRGYQTLSTRQTPKQPSSARKRAS